MTISFILAVFLVICIVKHVLSTRLHEQSFIAPFEQTNTRGTRIVSHDWVESGSTTIHNNFIRLTPDRQSKRGAIWNKQSLKVNEFTAMLKFRISGQGEKFFGDGLALWITRSQRHFDGPLHGNEEHFYGVGIIFDTFKNTENLEAHRDVLVLVNDGQKSQEEMIGDAKSVQGCFANFRYHEKRADFSVMDKAAARITMKDDYLKIEIDENADGKFVDCVEIKELGLINKESEQKQWLSDAHVGLTASTGQLADNHDVISFEVYTDAKVMEKEDVHRMRKKDISYIGKHGTTADRLKKLGSAMKDLLERVETLEHETEHNNLAIDGDIKSLLKKIQEKSSVNDLKVEDIENKVREFSEKHLDGPLNDRLEGIENAVNGNIDRKIYNVDTKFQKAIKQKHETMTKEHQSRMGSWKLPFLIVLLVVVAALGAMYIFYIKIKKTHLL